jgi:hypothetical protein
MAPLRRGAKPESSQLRSGWLRYSFDENALGSRPESAHAINDQGDHKEQANPAAADNGTSNIKSAATEQQQKYEQNQ